MFFCDKKIKSGFVTGFVWRTTVDENSISNSHPFDVTKCNNDVQNWWLNRSQIQPNGRNLQGFPPNKSAPGFGENIRNVIKFIAVPMRHSWWNKHIANPSPWILDFVFAFR